MYVKEIYQWHSKMIQHGVPSQIPKSTQKMQIALHLFCG